MSNPNIKFYRSNQAPANPVEGFIWFKTDDRTIKLYKNNDWETYSGIVNATYDNSVLTITPATGDAIVVDLSAIGTLQEEVKKLEGIQDKVTTYVVQAISAETSKREAADKAINDVLNGTKNDDGSENTKGLVKEVEALRAEMNALGGIDGGDGIGGMIDAKINALDLPNTYEAKGAAADALDDAKAYADSLAANYDAAGSATTAEQNAKNYVDEFKTTINGVIEENERVTAEALNDLDTRVKDLESIDHDQLATDAASSAVATILDGAPTSFDTLKEVAAWIANNDHAQDVATLVTDVENLKKIDHDAYVAADTKVLDDAKAYADGLVMADGVAKFDAAGAAATAQAAAIAQAKLDAAEMLESYYNKTEVDGLVDGAKTYADGLKTAIDGVIEENERVTAASLTDLDSRIITLESVDHDAYVGADETVLSNAKTYADNLFTWAEY